jgi:glycosyltransferase involved in cell wall biosynthesis
MKILVAHNRYQQRGGEDAVFENEVKLLTASGHEVRTLIVSNDAIETNLEKALVLVRTAENPAGVAMMSEAVERFRPDIVHIHNFFPLLSPAIYKVCRRRGSAVVQTLHNYRTICAAAQLLRNGQVCCLCVRGSPLWGVVHRCYRRSVVGSAAVARMISVHRKRGTWSTEVDRFIALTEFGRRTFVEAGFPEDRIDIKPNFLEDVGESSDIERHGVLFVGRLSKEKGVRQLVEASTRYQFPLRVAGDGPESEMLQQLAHKNVVFLGQISSEAILKEIKCAAVVAIPSLWYEGFPMVLLEAFACATPVVGSRLGALAELIEDGQTGLHVPAGDSDKLGERIRGLLADTDLSRKLGNAARQIFLKKYTPAVNLKTLEDIYAKARSSLLAFEKRGSA